MRALPILSVLLLAGACTRPAAPPPPRTAPPTATAAPLPAVGLDRVVGRDAKAVTALLGPPALDLREGPARKLQFRGPACVLDAYLYPPPGGGAATVTWVDARTPVGGDMDRASCIAALVRR